MNMSTDKSQFYNAGPPSNKSWTRDEGVRRSLSSPSASNNSNKTDLYYVNKGMRTDASLVPPIRQTASIFKQPVTIIKNQDSYVKPDLKYGPQEKPRQLFWEKRLEGLRACDMKETELIPTDLPRGLLPVGPNVSHETLLQSVATALHVYNHPITGQTAPRNSLEKNPAIFLNPDQPLIQAISVCDDDIRNQEEKVNEIRRKLQQAINVIQ